MNALDPKRIFALAAVGFLVVAALGWMRMPLAISQEPPAKVIQQNARVKDAQKQWVQAGLRYMDVAKTRYQAGQASLGQMIAVSRDLARAEAYDAPAAKALSAYTRHRDRIKDFVKRAKAKFEVGEGGQFEVSEAEFALAEANILVLEREFVVQNNRQR